MKRSRFWILALCASISVSHFGCSSNDVADVRHSDLHEGTIYLFRNDIRFFPCGARISENRFGMHVCETPEHFRSRRELGFLKPPTGAALYCRVKGRISQFKNDPIDRVALTIQKVLEIRYPRAGDCNFDAELPEGDRRARGQF